ncbi:MAG: catalase/peroxidase HPI [bacterium]
MDSQSKCPMHAHATQGTRSNRDWWPNQLNLKMLHQNPPAGRPTPAGCDYAAEFAKLDFAALKADLAALMTDSQPWWPADYGHYGPLFIRMAWHSAGTYRTGDGRGGAGSGTQRFAPLNSWPDNGNLDKARRLLWPIKRKYGRAISWADLMILAGNVALETMGFQTFGFGGGREDVWEPEEDIYWGAEAEWLGDKRYSGERELDDPLAAVQMGLIYVNPEGPNGKPDPMASARDIRETFARMAMDDERPWPWWPAATPSARPTAPVIRRWSARSPRASIEEQGLGWTNRLGTGKGVHTTTSGLEGAWTPTPISGTTATSTRSSAMSGRSPRAPRGRQWTPSDPAAATTVPDAHDPARRHAPMMSTADLALRTDPAYAAISRRFHKDPAAFADAFARAWFKLTHRDMGPRARYLGPEVPAEELIWQDPLPAAGHPLVGAEGIADLKARLGASGLSTADLVRTAWASASTFRGSDKRGGANGARIRLAPQKDWAVNEPAELARVLGVLEGIQQAFNAAQADGTRVSLADLIVLGGGVGVEQAARAAGFEVTVPFTPGRTDATQAQTDVESFSVLEPFADGFRGYQRARARVSAEELLIDKAQLLTLTAPEMTVLVGGLRAIGIGGQACSPRPGALTNDFFVHLLDMSTAWFPVTEDADLFHGPDRTTGRSSGQPAGWSWCSAPTPSSAPWPRSTPATTPGAARARLRGGLRQVMELDRFDLA